MSVAIRSAEPADIAEMAGLLVEDARGRRALNPVLWAMAGDARDRVAEAVAAALAPDEQPFRQKWLLAEAGGTLVGIAHSMLLPVPPIYAGQWGDPGLLLEDCVLAPSSPPGTDAALLAAAETDLRAAGAELLLASSVPGGAWQSCFDAHGYEPLTLYLSKRLAGEADRADLVRSAGDEDIEDIVGLSASNRRILSGLDPFWTPHPQADSRFGNWMRRSLTLTDRDMMVAGLAGELAGYCIAQPASPLHFPPAHDIGATGVVDDWFHRDFADPLSVRDGGRGASALLRAAEAAFAGRGYKSVFVVCPAAWSSKRSVLEEAGYTTALVWMIKRRDAPY